MLPYHEDIAEPSLIQTKINNEFNPIDVIGKRVSSAIEYFEKHQISYTFKDSHIGMGSTSTSLGYIYTQGTHIHNVYKYTPGTHIYNVYNYNISNKDDWIIVAFYGVA